MIRRRRFLRALVLAAVAAALHVVPLSARQAADSLIARIEAALRARDGLGRLTLQQVMDSFNVPGVSVAVLRCDVEVTRQYQRLLR